MTIQDVIDIIESEGEHVFFNENGLLDKEYIMERFNLTNDQYRLVLKGLENVDR